MVRAPVPKSSCPTNLQYIQDFIASQSSPSLVSSTSSPVSIYVCGDAFQTFISEYSLKIQRPFIIVSGDGDKTMFRETVPQKPNLFVLFMLNPLLRGLYCQNMDLEDCRLFLKDKITKLWKANAVVFKTEGVPTTLDDVIQWVLSKLRQIPIGMDYHTITANPKHRWLTKGEHATTPISQERTLLKEIRSKMTPFYTRKMQIYSNVMLCIDRFNDRVSAVSTIPKALLYEQKTFIPNMHSYCLRSEMEWIVIEHGRRCFVVVFQSFVQTYSKNYLKIFRC
jgi:hypothetical protein